MYSSVSQSALLTQTAAVADRFALPMSAARAANLRGRRRRPLRAADLRGRRRRPLLAADVCGRHMLAAGRSSALPTKAAVAGGRLAVDVCGGHGRPLRTAGLDCTLNPPFPTKPTDLDVRARKSSQYTCKCEVLPTCWRRQWQACPQANVELTYSYISNFGQGR